MPETVIKLLFEVGEKIWRVDNFGYSYEVSCLHCDGGGNVLLANGKTMTCGICSGRKTHLKHAKCKNRPVYCEITGYDIHRNGEVWVYVKGCGVFIRPGDIIRSFREARLKAKALNVKYSCPREEEDWGASYGHSHPVYWGKRVSKPKRT